MSENLKHYLETWELADPQLLAQTTTSHLYTVTHGGDRVVLKLLTAIGEEEIKGAVALRYWDGQGAVRLLRADEQAHLLEYADGEDLIPMVKQGEDEQATAIISDVLRQLHRTTAMPETPPEGLTPLTVWFRSLFKKAAADREAGLNSIYVWAGHMAEQYFAQPLDTRVLHGDLHHENIRRHAQRGWLTFDPKGLVGERTFDAANVLRNPLDAPDVVESEDRLLRMASTLAAALDVETSRVLAFGYLLTCLSASWILEDGEYPRNDLRIVALIEPHLEGW